MGHRSWQLGEPTRLNYGIMIANTTAHFTISGVSVFCNCLDGIVLFQIENGLLQDSQISVPEVGMKVDTSNNFQITGNHIESGDSTVMSFYNSDNFDASYNILQGGAFAIKGSYVSDASIVGNTGGAEDGIALDNTSGLLISENSLVGHVSISVQSCGDLTVDSNTATAYDEGIGLSDCSNVLV